MDAWMKRQRLDTVLTNLLSEVKRENVMLIIKNTACIIFYNKKSIEILDIIV